MLEQRIQNRQPDALRGVGVILGVAAAVLAGSAFFSRLENRLGTLSSLLFIAYGCAIAWFLLNWYVMRFIYTANADRMPPGPPAPSAHSSRWRWPIRRAAGPPSS